MKKEFSKIIDISLPIHKKMIIYPKNPQVKFVVHQKMPRDGSNITRVTLGTHTGTHIDAPSHVFQRGARSIDQYKLTQLIGPCRVLDMMHCEESVALEDVKKERIKKHERILIKTKNSLRGYKRFRSDFIYLDGDAAEYIANEKIILFGTDYLSIKKRGGPDNRSHTKLLSKNIVIIEGLDLSKVKPGRYNLVCLPLRFVGLDGAPARAILLS